MPLFGHCQQDLRQEVETFDMQAQLACFSPKQVSLGARDVADVHELPELVVLLRNRIFFDIDLQAFAVLHQVGESGLSHPADCLDAATDPDADKRLELLRRFRPLFSQDLRNGVAEIKTLPVGGESEGFDLANALRTLPDELLLERQCFSYALLPDRLLA